VEVDRSAQDLKEDVRLVVGSMAVDSVVVVSVPVDIVAAGGTELHAYRRTLGARGAKVPART
jgi:hypothetical protein